MNSKRKPEGEPEPEIPGVGPQRPEVEEPVPRHGEVDNGEPDGQQWNHAKEEGDLPGSAIGGLGIDIGQSRQMLRMSRIGHRVTRLVGFGQFMAVVIAAGKNRTGAGIFAHLAFAPLAAIQMAKATSEPSPMIHAHSPSLTGPRPPSARPPSLGRLCSSSR